MASRLSLHITLEDILGSKNVYFQPPESIKMSYPAIVYSRSDIRNAFADNLSYRSLKQYQIILIDKNPDSEFIDKLSKLPTCRYTRHYTSNNLNHDVFVIYY